MSNIQNEKIEQAVGILRELNVDAWMLYARETSEINEPCWGIVAPAGVVWPSAVIITAKGERFAIVGKYDDAAFRASGLYTAVMAYTQGIGETLRSVLSELDPKSIGLNFSKSNTASDGLTYGMFLQLQDHLKQTPYAERLASADPIVSRLRGRKTATEEKLIRAAIRTTMKLFDEVTPEIKLGVSERALYDFMQHRVTELGLGYAWDVAGNPIVNSGPNSSVGHGPPISNLRVEPGHLVHMDFGIKQDEYCSDIQRMWYVRRPGEKEAPASLRKACAAIAKTIQEGARALKPGVAGWQVDARAREVIVGEGYPEYQHAFGHQLGRTAHDGSTLLGPRWERYGETPFGIVERGQVYTLELGVITEAGMLALEEDVIVTAMGCEFLEDVQSELWLV
ncbi:MAG TPA: M24 family metallopeptidase [Candidatus Eremiobacteraceae bacterium]|nr:M24 family metallopeptidase [Candidatus Eremiobacteraceae bacterium]